jgi:hypothetical protein
MNLHYFAEYICGSRFIYWLLYISWAVNKLPGYTIYTLAGGHGIDQFVSEIEPDLRMYQELMYIDLPFPIQYPIVRA